LVLASGHPFITTLHWCFQTKVILIFWTCFIFPERVISTEIYHQYDNLMFRCICKIVKMDYELHHVCLAIHLSVCLSMWNNSAPTGRIFITFDCIKFNKNFWKSVKIIRVSLNCDKNSW
jgi:hypothetical protein